MEIPPYKEASSEETIQRKLDQSTMILQNINAYFLLIDEEFIVRDTNYYSLNRLPAPEDGVIKRVGDLLHCRNAAAAGECGKHEQCKLCGVRAAIGKAFCTKEGFKKLNASMNLLSEDENRVIPCDVSVSGTYLDIHGKGHMVLTVYDVTELKNIQRLLNIEREKSISADKLKSAFIANISHEIRTPLNAIVGFSGLIATASSEEEKKMYMDIISENNERLLRLINDIFDLSQIESGTLNFEYSEFDANDLIRELEGIFMVKLADNPSVDLVCEANLQPIMMYSERHRIIQVMANLIHNAIKFTKSGEIRFGCRIEGTDEAFFYVSDTGIGIPKEEQEKIFSHFKKLDREVPGTGLGLTLSQSIIRNLGGRAGLESEVNKGSTFWFVLPLTVKGKTAK
ncbi:sensor histidine kinase [Bacteroides oleiciplenus]|uniref:sensor histidine kinase n=1 Tax=Bacteroides oleiciplenus TaxID=626931 RepID=UPI0026DD3D4F|nr:HAMP domain-containing sensor histidine kinase [Bacteroides oleiciplenus]